MRKPKITARTWRDTAIQWALPTLLFTAWGSYMVWFYWDAWAMDASALYFAAHFAETGEVDQIYAAPEVIFNEGMPAAWAALMRQLGAEELAVAYVYPPIWAHVLAPLAGWLDPYQFYNGLRISMMAAFGAALVAAYQVMRPSMPPLAYTIIAVALCHYTQPFTFGWFLGQPQFLVMALVLWSMVFLRRGLRGGSDLGAGLCLGLAAAIKVSPILFCLLFLIEGRSRAAAIALGTATLIACLSFVIAGVGPHFEFIRQTQIINELIPLLGNNITFETMTHQLFSPNADIRHPDSVYVSLGSPVISTLNLIAMILVIGGGLWATRGAARPLALQVLLMSILLPFFSPLAWSHYYVPVFLLAAGLWGVLPLPRAALIVVILAGAFNLPLFFVMQSAQRITPDYLLITGAALLAVAALVFFWGRRAQPQT